MDHSIHTQFETSRKFTYSYFHSPPTAPNKGKYILFLHGFPSSSYDWHHQMTYFSSKGYGIIAPDLLGYGGTSKPVDIQSYRGKAMATDMAEILDHEKIRKVVGVAHDWGSFLLSRLVNYYPAMLEKLVFLDVGYSSPGYGLTRQTLKAINDQVQSALGFSILGYFLFFGEEYAADLMNANSKSAQSLFHSNDVDIQKEFLGRPGLSQGKLAPRESYFTPEDEAHYQKTFAPEHGGGGYDAPIRWYIAQLENVNEADEKEISEADRTIKQPTLLISSANFITQIADFPSQMKPLVPNLKLESTSGGHWIQLEYPDEVNRMLEDFI